jgi:gag-polypeptide of LTR copia-type
MTAPKDSTRLLELRRLSHSFKYKSTLHTSFRQVMEPNTSDFFANGKILLDGTNYIPWKQFMTSLLQSKGLYKFVTIRAPELKRIYKDDAEKLDKLLDDDERALGLMKCYIVQSYTDIVAKCTTALDAWNALEKFFAGKETFNKVHLLEQLIDGKLQETSNPAQDVQEFVKQKNELVERLAYSGLKIAEELQVAIMLARLPESYDTLRRIMESKNELSLLELTAELNREAVRRGTKRTYTEAAMISTDLPAERQIKRVKKHVRNSSIQCSFCRKPRHDAENCWLNPESKQFDPRKRQAILDVAKVLSCDKVPDAASRR